MRRAMRLKNLQSKLTKLQGIAERLRGQILKDGKVDFEVCKKLNKVVTDINLTKKKIGFSKRGGSYLGEALKDSTPRVMEND